MVGNREGVELSVRRKPLDSPLPPHLQREDLVGSSWNKAKVWAGSNNQVCTYCKEWVERGQWSKQNKDTGHIYHDSCAEELGAYNGLS